MNLVCISKESSSESRNKGDFIQLFKKSIEADRIFVRALSILPNADLHSMFICRFNGWKNENIRFDRLATTIAFDGIFIDGSDRTKFRPFLFLSHLNT